MSTKEDVATFESLLAHSDALMTLAHDPARDPHLLLIGVTGILGDLITLLRAQNSASVSC